MREVGSVAQNCKQLKVKWGTLRREPCVSSASCVTSVWVGRIGWYASTCWFHHEPWSHMEWSDFPIHRKVGSNRCHPKALRTRRWKFKRVPRLSGRKSYAGTVSYLFICVNWNAGHVLFFVAFWVADSVLTVLFFRLLTSRCLTGWSETHFNLNTDSNWVLW